MQSLINLNAKHSLNLGQQNIPDEHGGQGEGRPRRSSVAGSK